MNTTLTDLNKKTTNISYISYDENTDGTNIDGDKVNISGVLSTNETLENVIFIRVLIDDDINHRESW